MGLRDASLWLVLLALHLPFSSPRLEDRADRTLGGDFSTSSAASSLHAFTSPPSAATPLRSRRHGGGRLASSASTSSSSLAASPPRSLNTLFAEMVDHLTATPSRSLPGVPMGMESGELSNDRLAASSHFGEADSDGNDFRARAARLRGAAFKGGWRPARDDAEQWISMDLGEPFLLTGVETQGMRGGADGRWVTEYALETSMDGRAWRPYEGSRRFKGNTDRDTVVRRMLDTPATVRCLRIRPRAWSSKGVGLRFEVLGIHLGKALGVQSGRALDFGDMRASSSLESGSTLDGAGQSGPETGRLFAREDIAAGGGGRRTRTTPSSGCRWTWASRTC